MARFEREARFLGLARARARGRLFDAVIERVAQQVAERRIEHFEDVAVDLSRFAIDDETHALAERARQIAHHARPGVGGVAERTHAALQGFVVEALRELGAAPVDAVEVVETFGELAFERAQRRAHVGERGARVGVERVAVAFVELAERRQHAALRAAHAQQAVGERTDAARLHQRLAREPEQTVERARAHAQHAVAFVRRAGRCGFGRRRCGRWRWYWRWHCCWLFVSM